MHRLVRENLEEILTGTNADHPASRHVAQCEECREDIAAMGEHAALLQSWRAPAAKDDLNELEPRGGFYARVMERIEKQGPASIWDMFFESMFGRRLAVASLALAVLLGMYLVSSESREPEIALSETSAVEVLPVPVVQGQFVAMHDSAGVMLPGEPDEDSVLVNLVTYQEQ